MDIRVLKQIIHNLRAMLGVSRMLIRYALLGLLFKSRSYILGIQVIGNRIEVLRQQQSQAPTSKQVKREINESNKDALIESLKRKIKKLEDDNKQLRE